MLEVADAHVRFNPGTQNEVHALRGVSVSFQRGEFVTIVGSNGAGKSTLTNVIAGSVRPSRGSVSIGGVNCTKQSDFQRARRVARVFADPLAGTVGSMSIADNLALALARGRRRTLRMALGRRVRRQLRDVAAGLGLGLENRLQDNVGQLSSGQRQSLTLAMACAAAPDVLILDEHLAALDPVTRSRLTEITVQAATSDRCVTLMVTHSMEDALRLGQRLLVMSGGQIVADYAGAEKRELTVDSLIQTLRQAGGELSDRIALSSAEAAPGVVTGRT